jgi:oligosaccharide repeat unit polymerase
MIFLSIAFVAGDGTRLPIIRVFLVLFITISIISKVSIRGLIAFSLISFALVIGLSMLTNKFYTILSSNDNILLSSIESILARIVTGNQINDVIVIDYLSKGTMSYYYGFQHYVQVINSFPGVSNYESFSLTIARLYNAGNSTTYMTPTYLAVSYADFGFIITLINYTFIGVIIAYFEKKMFSFTKSPLNITLISILMLEFGFMALSGIIKFLPALIVIALIYIFMYFSIVLTIKTYSHKQKTIINGGIV